MIVVEMVVIMKELITYELRTKRVELSKVMKNVEKQKTYNPTLGSRKVELLIGKGIEVGNEFLR